MMRRRIAGVAAAAAFLTVVTGCGGSNDPAVPTMTLPKPKPTKIISDEKVDGNVHVVHLKGDKFSPQTVTIKAGEAVKWVFDDEGAHTATGLRDKGMIINSPVLQKGSEYQIVFHTPEEIDYICAIHPEARGKVIIKPK